MAQRLIGYRSTKAAQVAAYFALRAGGEVNKLKLSKLLYLSERESMAQRGRPMFYDEYYALKDGPICSNALNGVNGVGDKAQKTEWAEYILKTDNRTIKAAPTANDERLDQLSKSDLRVLQTVWERFGWMEPNVLRRWTHTNCREYVEVTTGRLPISYKEIYASLGYENPVEMEDHIAEYRSLEATLSAEKQPG